MNIDTHTSCTVGVEYVMFIRFLHSTSGHECHGRIESKKEKASFDFTDKNDSSPVRTKVRWLYIEGRSAWRRRLNRLLT